MYNLKNYRFHSEKERNETYYRKFLSKFKQVNKEDCWIWEGETNRSKPPNSPYGRYRFQDKPHHTKTEYAHRLSYMLWTGNNIENIIGHECDNPLCVNPHHLSLMTPRENTQDMIKKGRGLTKKHQSRAGRNGGLFKPSQCLHL